MLENNIEIMDKVVSLETSEILEILKEKNLSNYGNGTLLEQFASSKGIIAGLFNGDLDHVLNEVVNSNPNGIVCGLYALAKIYGFNEATIIVSDESLVDKLKEVAKELNFNLHIEISNLIDVRKYRDFAKIHFVALVNVSNVLLGKNEKTIVVINGQCKEIEYETSLNELVNYDELKAVCIGEEFIVNKDLKISKDIKLNSGLIRAIDNNNCIVNEAKKEILRFRKQSCGTCTFCREGLFQVYTILEDITNNKAKKNDVELLNEIAESMQTQTNCTLGKTAALPVLSLIQNFEDELTSHTKKKVCPTGTCKAFQTIYIDPSLCEGCGDCMDVCPTDCIEGKKKYISMIDEFDCIKCGKCINACTNGAIKMTSGRLPKLPTKLTKVGRFKK